MKQIMIDIEGLSLAPRALILSIGAVECCGAAPGEEFYLTLDAYAQPQRHVSASTALWWIKQALTNPVAATALFSGEHASMKTALDRLAAFCARIRENDADTLEVWFNGPQYDAVVLESAFADEGIKVPWSYNEVRDCRTIFKLAEEKGWDSAGIDHTKFVEHNALADAKIQALRLRSALTYLGID